MFGVVCGSNPNTFKSSTRVWCGIILSNAASAASKFVHCVVERWFSDMNIDLHPMAGRTNVARSRMKNGFTDITFGSVVKEPKRAYVTIYHGVLPPAN